MELKFFVYFFSKLCFGQQLLIRNFVSMNNRLKILHNIIIVKIGVSSQNTTWLFSHLALCKLYTYPIITHIGSTWNIIYLFEIKIVKYQYW